MRQLAVYFNNVKAGILTEKYPGKDYSFQYLDEYVDSTMPPISITFPKQKKVYISEHLFPFFSTMLPEGSNRRVICNTQRIDENDSFGLLTTMADKDFIGAINVRRIKND